MAHFFRAVLDFISPPLCHLCRSYISDAGELHICPACRERLPPVLSPLCNVCGIPFVGAGADHTCGDCLTDRPYYDSARAALLYDGAARDLIHSFKYNNRTHLRRPLALLSLEHLAPFLTGRASELIVPVPLHRNRLRSRGFNQSVLLGALFSERLSIPMLKDGLIRIRKTTPQVDLSAVERKQNVKGAFSVKFPELVQGKRILLIDDVMTTGSTMNECAKVLKKAGAEVVAAAVVARAA